MKKNTPTPVPRKMYKRDKLKSEKKRLLKEKQIQEEELIKALREKQNTIEAQLALLEERISKRDES